MKTLLLILLFVPFISFAHHFPPEWWIEVPRTEASSWEILPQDAASGEVILSKRTELGIFSNFAATPFVLDGKEYASVEGLWQAMKYPDPSLPNDPRLKITEWPFTRDEVAMMTGFEAKDAGNAANKIYSKYHFKVISYGEKFFDYKDQGEGSDFHYFIIKRALRAKLDQTSGLWDLLIRTGCLTLKPDHKFGANDPASYRYFEIFMILRSEKQFVPCY